MEPGGRREAGERERRGKREGQKRKRGERDEEGGSGEGRKEDVCVLDEQERNRRIFALARVPSSGGLYSCSLTFSNEVSWSV